MLHLFLDDLIIVENTMVSRKFRNCIYIYLHKLLALYNMPLQRSGYSSALNGA